MAAKTADRIRNIAFVGHSTAGKTTLLEHILLKGGVISRMGTIGDGNTVCDYDEQEHERKHSMDLACCHIDYEGVQLNLIDTAGYRDFIGQFYCAVGAVDCLVVVVSADDGVQTTTRKVWEVAEELNIPRFVVINRCDRDHANFDDVLSQVQEQLSPSCVPFTVPDGSGSACTKVLALLEGEIGDAAEAAKSLMETIVETDEALMERYLEGNEPSSEELIAAFAGAVASCGVFPVLATSAEKDVGIAKLIDAMAKYAPPASTNPLGREAFKLDSPDEKFPVKLGADDPFSAFVFKVVSDPYVGKLSYIRVLSGSIATHGSFINPHSGKPEKLGKIVVLQGKEQNAVDSVSAGEICALVKIESLKPFDVITGDTLLGMAPPRVPVPMYSKALFPKTKADEKKFGESFTKLLDEDVTLTSDRDRRTHEFRVSSMSQLHLQIVLSRLKSRYGVEVDITDPKIPYLETVTVEGDAQHRHKKQSGGSGEFAEVWLRVAPKERGEGMEFKNEVFGGAISAGYVQSAEKGIRMLLDEGVLCGCEIVDIMVTIYDGKEHPVDSKDIAFQKAGRGAFKTALESAKPTILEPIVNLEVTFPSDFTGEIQGDLNRRRGRVQGVDAHGTFQVLKAQVPLAEIADYASSLGSMTGGQGSYVIEPAHYEQVPGNVQKEIIAAYQKSKNAD